MATPSYLRQLSQLLPAAPARYTAAVIARYNRTSSLVDLPAVFLCISGNCSSMRYSCQLLLPGKATSYSFQVNLLAGPVSSSQVELSAIPPKKNCQLSLLDISTSCVLHVELQLFLKNRAVSCFCQLDQPAAPRKYI